MAIPRRSLINREVQQRDARLFLVVTEGARTEPDYFRALEDRRVLPVERVKLHLCPPVDGASAPRHLLGRAEAAQRAITPWQPEDAVWLVFDVDRQSGGDRLDQVRATVRDAHGRGWNAAVSNPCFELWFLLHAPEEPGACGMTCREVAAAVREKLGQYNKTHVPTACLARERLDLACQRAAARDADVDAPIPEVGSTRVYRLLRALLDLERP